MKKIRSYFPQIFGGIASGLLVGIGGTVLLSVENREVGAVLFTVALLLICAMGLYLYTGKIGFLAERFSLHTLYELIVGLIGNFLGATFTGLIVRIAKPSIIEKAQAACEARIENGLLRAFLLGYFCGVLMYAAVKTYLLGMPIGVIFCIPVFILSGFEHSIADMFYFALAGMFTLDYLCFIAAVVLGNSVGAMFLAILWKYCLPTDKK